MLQLFVRENIYKFLFLLFISLHFIQNDMVVFQIYLVVHEFIVTAVC